MFGIVCRLPLSEEAESVAIVGFDIVAWQQDGAARESGFDSV